MGEPCGGESCERRRSLSGLGLGVERGGSREVEACSRTSVVVFGEGEGAESSVTRVSFSPCVSALVRWLDSGGGGLQGGIHGVEIVHRSSFIVHRSSFGVRRSAFGVRRSAFGVTYRDGNNVTVRWCFPVTGRRSFERRRLCIQLPTVRG